MNPTKRLKEISYDIRIQSKQRIWSIEPVKQNDASRFIFHLFINVPYSVHFYLIGWILNISFGNCLSFLVRGLNHFWLKPFKMIAFDFILTSVVCALVPCLGHWIWIKMRNVSLIQCIKSKIKTFSIWKTVVALHMERTTLIEGVKSG